MAETYLVYSSAALFTMASISLILSLIFRWKSGKINRLAQDVKPNVYDKTFVVFSPFEDRKKMIHKLLTFIPWVAMFAGFALALLMLVLVSSGLLLAIVITIVSMNLIILEEAAEAHQFSSLLTKAHQRRSDFGLGDMRLIRETQNILPKLSRYYLILTIAFLSIAVPLQAMSSTQLTSILSYSSVVFQAGSYTGTFGPVTIALIFGATVSIILVFARKAKNRFFS